MRGDRVPPERKEVGLGAGVMLHGAVILHCEIHVKRCAGSGSRRSARRWGSAPALYYTALLFYNVKCA